MTTVTTGTTLTGTWQLAGDCSKFAVGGKIFYLNSNKNGYVSFTGTIPAFTALDQNINFGIVGTQVYALNYSALTITNVYNLSSTLLTTTNIYTLNSTQVIITSTNSSSAQVLAYSVNASTGNYINCMTYLDTSFNAAPNIYVSPGLTKILIAGTISSTAQKYNAFHVNYTNNQYFNITLPTISVTTFSSLVVGLYDQFLYLKQNIQLVLAFVKDVNALQISNITLSSTLASTIDKAVLFSDPNGQQYFLIEATSSTTVTVTQLIVSAQQAILNSQFANVIGSAAVATTITSSGQFQACPPGCADCSTGPCASCVGGYVLDTSYICNPCGPNCLTCLSTDFLNCQTCAPGATLSATNTCNNCDSSCVTCSGSTSSDCTSCPIGSSIIGNGPTYCTPCPTYCATCSSPIVCLTCIPGFAIGSDNKCSRGCSAYCSSCDPNDILTCTSCSSGLFLLNS